jgi:hypothetical protein
LRAAQAKPECRAARRGPRCPPRYDSLRSPSTADTLEYVAKGPGSRRDLAIGDADGEGKPQKLHQFRPSFMNSNWKLFHDALQMHRLYVTNELLPRFALVRQLTLIAAPDEP